MPIDIRPLTPDDAPRMRELRLRALREHPEAFLSHVDDAVQETVEDFARRLQPDPQSFVLGAFEGDELIGQVGFHRETRRKIRHKGNIWGMYVRRESSGQGVGRRLLARALEMARAMPGLEQIHLQVAISNLAGYALYRSMGFETYGVEPHASRDEGVYLDDAMMVLRL